MSLSLLCSYHGLEGYVVKWFLSLPVFIKFIVNNSRFVLL